MGGRGRRLVLRLNEIGAYAKITDRDEPESFTIPVALPPYGADLKSALARHPLSRRHWAAPPLTNLDSEHTITVAHGGLVDGQIMHVRVGRARPHGLDDASETIGHACPWCRMRQIKQRWSGLGWTNALRDLRCHLGENDRQQCTYGRGVQASLLTNHRLCDRDANAKRLYWTLPAVPP